MHSTERFTKLAAKPRHCALGAVQLGTSLANLSAYTRRRARRRVRARHSWPAVGQRGLDDSAVDTTNNRAERALRPAVIARKLSCGNKTEAGRQVWQILASLAVNCDGLTAHSADRVSPIHTY